MRSYGGSASPQRSGCCSGSTVRCEGSRPRAIQGLAQAIGFLCAGVIFVAEGSVYGLTTAASLWMTSSLGMAAGAGMYQIAVAGVMLAVLILNPRVAPDAAPAGQ
jgi:uncharacterized membrane protein YhiD involved in acid resistance